MDAPEIRARMDEVLAKVPPWSHDHDRAVFVEAADREVNCWIEAGPTGLWFDHFEGTRRYTPPCGILMEEEYRFFEEAFDDERIDKLSLARAFVESILVICGRGPTIWSASAVESLGPELPDRLASQSPEEIAALAINALAAMRKQVKVTTEPTRIYRSRSQATEQRDKFIYENYRKGVGLAIIRNKLEVENENDRSWSLLASNAAVTRAAQRYAQRHRLPVPRFGEANLS